MATSHPRIQVTEDPELTRALSAAASHLPTGLPRSQQVRDLAIVGARALTGSQPYTEEERRARLERLAGRFLEGESAGVDSDLLREGKLRAWPLP